MSARKVKNAIKGCGFCDSSGPMSREHVWPKWAHNFLPDGADYHRAKFVGFGAEAQPVQEWRRQGAPKLIQLNAVCETCNNTWMSVLEVAVAKLLKPMMRGETVMLDAAAQRTLAEYFTMKAMVADMSRPGEHIFWSLERRAFFEHRLIPDGTSVTIARYNWAPDDLVAQYNKETPAGWAAPDHPDHRFGVSNQTIRFGELFVQVLSLRREAPLPSMRPGTLLRLHPAVNEQLRWPPLFRLSTPEAYILQHVFEARQARLL